MLLEPQQVPGLVGGIADAESLLTTLSSTPREERSALPSTTGEASSSSGDTTLVQVDEWNGYLDVKLTTFKGGSSARTGQWVKFGAWDVRDVIGLLIKAFDEISCMTAPEGSSGNEDPLEN
jgi:hypothetical protein